MGPRVLAVHIRVMVFGYSLCLYVPRCCTFSRRGTTWGTISACALSWPCPVGARGGKKGPKLAPRGGCQGAAACPSPRAPWGPSSGAPRAICPRPPWLCPAPAPAPGGRKQGLRAGREWGARGRPGTEVQRSRGAKSEPGGRGNFWCERSNRGSDVCLMFRGRFDALIRESSASPIHHSSSSAIQTPL